VAKDSPESDARGVEIPSPRNLGEEEHLQSLGAWKIRAELARAPGVLLYDARRGNDRCLLQVVPLRPTARREDRQRMAVALRAIEAETRELRDREPELMLVEHGVIDQEDGRRLVYWALSWTPAAERIDPRGTFIGSPDELIIVAHDLLERLTQRDARGLRDPLLSEHLVACDQKLGSTVVGLPLVVDPRWTDDDLASPRLLDEEQGSAGPMPTATGDLHRLGLALEAFGRVIGGLPDPLLQLFRRFRGDGETPSFGSPADALEELEALDERGELGVRPQSLSAPRVAPAQTLVVPVQRSFPSAHPTLAHGETEDELDTASHDATVAMEPVPRPGRATPARSEGRDGEPTVRSIPSQPTVVEPTAAQTPPENAPHIPESSGTVVGVRLPGPEFLARNPPEGGSGRGSGAGGPPTYDRVVPGPALPGSTPPRPAREPDDLASESELELSGRSKLLMAIGLAAVGLIGLVGVELFAPEDRMSTVVPETNVLRHMSAEDDVALSVTPDSAVIVSERDGQILGRGRVRMMVGDEPPVVIVHAAGYAPTRVVLPTRGRLALSMGPASEPNTCLVRLVPPPGVELETLDGSPVSKKATQLEGATVVRDTTGQGAWLARCPVDDAERSVELGSRPPPRRVDLAIAWPAGARVTIDGEPQGATPISRTVRSGFVRVEAETEAGTVRRWIPAFSDTEVELPEPKPEPEAEGVREAEDGEAG
jgi:hypothetical protein